jgi:hypothetical protein
VPNSMTRATGGCVRPPTPHPGIGEIVGAGEIPGARRRARDSRRSSGSDAGSDALSAPS